MRAKRCRMPRRRAEPRQLAKRFQTFLAALAPYSHDHRAAKVAVGDLSNTMLAKYVGGHGAWLVARGNEFNSLLPPTSARGYKRTHDVFISTAVGACTGSVSRRCTIVRGCRRAHSRLARPVPRRTADRRSGTSCLLRAKPHPARATRCLAKAIAHLPIGSGWRASERQTGYGRRVGVCRPPWEVHHRS